MSAAAVAVEEGKLNQEALVLKDKALSISVIESEEQYKIVAEVGKAAASLEKQIVDFFVDIKGGAYKAWKAICAKENDTLAPVLEVKQHCGSLAGIYLAEEKRKQEAEQRRLEEVARRAEEDRRVAEAAELERQGKREEAVQVLDAEPTVPVAVVAPKTVPKVAGVVGRTNYSAKVVDFKLLVRAVAEGRVPYLALLPNESYLNNSAKQARTTEILGFPGVQVEAKAGTAFRG